jgi:hypothetical protein
MRNGHEEPGSGVRSWKNAHHVSIFGMVVSMTRKDLQKLAADEMAVVLYLRLLFNLPLAAVLGLMLGYVSGCFGGNDSGDKAVLPALCFGGAAYVLWLVWTLWAIRRELTTRSALNLSYTPTFRLWGRFAKGVALVSMARHLLRGTSLDAGLTWMGGMAWVLSCLMAGFYLSYMLILLVMQRPPSFGIVSDFLFSLGGAWTVPAELAN